MRNEEDAVVGYYLLRDLYDLFDRLAFTEDDFRKASSLFPVMVDLGKTDIRVRAAFRYLCNSVCHHGFQVLKIRYIKNTISINEMI